VIEVVLTTIDAVPAVPSDKISISSAPSPITTIDLPALVSFSLRTTPGPVTVTVIDSATADPAAFSLITRMTPLTVEEAVANVATAL